MCRSFSAASVSCLSAHSIRKKKFHANKRVNICKLWYIMQVCVNFCKLCKKVNTCSPAWDVITSSWLSSLPWVVFLIFSAAPSGKLFLTLV